MNNKTYADECLERAEKATPGPWEALFVFGSPDLPISIQTQDAIPIVHITEECSKQPSEDLRFIAHARIDVPELAKRLNAATMRLREAAQVIHDLGFIDNEEYEDELNYIAKQLEGSL